MSEGFISADEDLDLDAYFSEVDEGEFSGEPTNRDRAFWAADALTYFANRFGETNNGLVEGDLVGQNIRDLITNLMHLWDDTEGTTQTFDELYEWAKGMYEEEVELDG